MTNKEERDLFNRVYMETRRKINKVIEILECSVDYLHDSFVIHYKEKEFRIYPITIYEKSVGEIIDVLLGELK